MTAKELKEMFNQIDWNSVSDEELTEIYVTVRSETVRINRIMNIRKHLKIHHLSKDNKTE